MVINEEVLSSLHLTFPDLGNLGNGVDVGSTEAANNLHGFFVTALLYKPALKIKKYQ